MVPKKSGLGTARTVGPLRTRATRLRCDVPAALVTEPVLAALSEWANNKTNCCSKCEQTSGCEVAMFYNLTVVGNCFMYTDKNAPQVPLVGASLCTLPEKTFVANAWSAEMNHLATLLGFMLAGRRLRYGRFSWPLGPAISLLILAGEEFSQMLITTRVFSPQDLCATAAGSLLGAYLVDGLSRRRAVPAAPCRPTSPQTH